MDGGGGGVVFYLTQGVGEGGCDFRELVGGESGGLLLGGVEALAPAGGAGFEVAVCCVGEVGEGLVRETGFFEAGDRLEVGCVEIRDGAVMLLLVAVHSEGALVEVVLDDVFLDLFKVVESAEVVQCLLPVLQLVVDREFPLQDRHPVELLHERQVLAGIPLGLLSHKQRKIQVIQTQSVVKQLVDIGQEANMLNGALRQCLILLHQLSHHQQPIIQRGRVLADVRGDDILKISLLLSAELLQDSITDSVDLVLALDGLRWLSSSRLRVPVHRLCDILLPTKRQHPNTPISNGRQTSASTKTSRYSQAP